MGPGRPGQRTAHGLTLHERQDFSALTVHSQRFGGIWKTVSGEIPQQRMHGRRPRPRGSPDGFAYPDGPAGIAAVQPFLHHGSLSTPAKEDQVRLHPERHYAVLFWLPSVSRGRLFPGGWWESNGLGCGRRVVRGGGGGWTFPSAVGGGSAGGRG